MLYPRFIFNNLGLKIIASIFAIVFWVYVQGELGVDFSRYTSPYLYQIKTVRNVPIEVLLAFDNSLDVSVKPTKIDIDLRGKEKDIKSVLTSDLLLYVDMRGLVNPGVYQVPLHLSHSFANITLANKLPLVEVVLEQRIFDVNNITPPEMNDSAKKPMLGI